MTTHQFIFSNERRHRLARHMAFWSVYCLGTFCTATNVDSLDDLRDWKFYFYNLKMLLFFLPGSIFMVYMFVYVLVPKLIMKGKYVTFVVAGIGIICFCFAINMIPGYVFNFYYPDPPAEPEQMHFLWRITNYNYSVHRGIPLAIGVTCIKLAKRLYVQQIENNRLAKLEAENRTRLFKSQIQPRFLFHSLQSLHKKIKNNPREAPDMVIRLADIFSYILYDCNDDYVSLEKELIAIKNFSITESMNEETVTEITLTIEGDRTGKYIVPLTLFSFLEKHTDTGSDVTFIDLHIHIKDSILELVMQIDDHAVSHAENTELYTLKKWKDNLPDNFSGYNINRDEQGNNFTIDATVALARTGTTENIHYYSMGDN